MFREGCDDGPTAWQYRHLLVPDPQAVCVCLMQVKMPHHPKAVHVLYDSASSLLGLPAGVLPLT